MGVPFELLEKETLLGEYCKRWVGKYLPRPDDDQIYGVGEIPDILASAIKPLMTDRANILCVGWLYQDQIRRDADRDGDDEAQ